MNKRTNRQMGRVAVRRAFTLVELMVVIVVIALLISILLPAVGSVKKQARVAASQAVLGTLATGLETFKADRTLGGDYPPSWSDGLPRDATYYGKVRNPYANLSGWQGAGQTGSIRISGAGLLVWGLIGADQLGSAGFKAINYDGRTQNQDKWSPDTTDYNDGSDTTSKCGLYALGKPGGSRAGEPLHTRLGTLVDTSRVRLSKWSKSGKFEIDAELEANPQTSDASTYPREYPMFLDAFGYPVLYWRADAAGTVLADTERQAQGGGPNQPARRGVYHWEDNAALVRTNVSNNDLLVLHPGAIQHKLGMYGGTDTSSFDPKNPPPDNGQWEFPRYIMDSNVQAKLMPQRADSYLLVSPGQDGLYGTGDDITNFKPSAR